MTPKSKLNPEWTEARVRSFIVSALRNASRRWKPKWVCLSNASVGKKINVKTGRLAKHYRCASCSNLYVAKDVQVDHIIPVIDATVGFVDWNTFIERLFIAVDGYQVLCKECHTKKTNKENGKVQTGRGLSTKRNRNKHAKGK